jgi:hypothetical protein
VDDIVKQIYLKMLMKRQNIYTGSTSLGDAISLLECLIDVDKDLPHIFWIGLK